LKRVYEVREITEEEKFEQSQLRKVNIFERYISIIRNQSFFARDAIKGKQYMLCPQKA
jgi:uncharacterized protein YnzC (UPF0291/DUF896 family)